MPAAFQTTVFLAQGFGVPGERYNDSPMRALPYTLVSASAAYNIVGATIFTVTSQQVAAAGGTGTFAGLLVDPKVLPLLGTVANGPLAPSLTVSNNLQSAIASMGTFVVTLPNTANIGDPVVYDTTTGAISSIPAGNALPGGTAFANALVDIYTVTAPGLAVITLSPYLVAPT